ncbi:MAG TPA: DUF3048 domain-containing protein [Chloroflexota bacterium]|nr:DUF3048 domain-containing protein [Chloroflexota bacterium]
MNWFAAALTGGSWKRPLLLLFLMACGALIVLGALHGSTDSQSAPAPTPTVAPPSPTPGSVLSTRPGDPALPMPLVSGVPARPHLYPRAATTDLTLGSTSAFVVDHSRSALFTPDPRYVSQDTLTDTGPGLPGPLSGLPTRQALASRRPIAVVVENYAPDARPQAGLNRASLVFETLAEGGITRFLAVYLEKDAPIVGPVRSARIYFDSWAAGLGAIFAHAGGNNDALEEIPYIASIDNIDGLGALGTAFWRASDRFAPHNFYTSTDQVRAVAGSGPAPALPVLLHKAPAPLGTRPKGGWIDIPFSSPDYEVRYTFDPMCDCYLRFMGGVAHRDAYSQRQIAPANVVVLFAPVVPDPNSDTPGSISVGTIGVGQAIFFRDGAEIQGTWRKDSQAAALQLLDAQGQPVALNPGQTWIEVAADGTAVTWSTK